MKMQLERLQLDPDVTIGALSVDGAFECWSLEDAVRRLLRASRPALLHALESAVPGPAGRNAPPE